MVVLSNFFRDSDDISDKSFNVYKYHYDGEGEGYFQTMNKSETDETKVFLTSPAFRNHTGSTVTMNKTNFTMKVKDTTHNCLLFANSVASSSFISGGA